MHAQLFRFDPRTAQAAKLFRAHWHEILLIAAMVIVVAALSAAWKFRHVKDPVEFERERRAYVNRIGRIVDGQVLEVIEKPAEETDPPGRWMLGKPGYRGKPGRGNHKLLVYSYSISGVSYEAAQDITGLEERACLDRLVAGQPAGVKYDPSNPSNSILLADDWSGLH